MAYRAESVKGQQIIRFVYLFFEIHGRSNFGLADLGTFAVSHGGQKIRKIVWGQLW